MASERVQRQIDRLLDEADEAAAQQDWETVRARAQHVLTFDPENHEGQAFLSAARRALEGTPPAVGLTTSVEQPAAAVDETQAQDSLAGGVFVGRHGEMDDLKAALEDALSGRGRLVVLAGEPGIGKTRTAQELGVLAAQRGAQVLWGHCYEDEGAPPYWPWVQAIRSYVRDRDPDQLRSEMGSGAADIAEVVSNVRERLPGLPPPSNLEPEQAPLLMRSPAVLTCRLTKKALTAPSLRQVPPKQLACGALNIKKAPRWGDPSMCFTCRAWY